MARANNQCLTDNSITVVSWVGFGDMESCWYISLALSATPVFHIPARKNWPSRPVVALVFNHQTVSWRLHMQQPSVPQQMPRIAASQAGAVQIALCCSSWRLIRYSSQLYRNELLMVSAVKRSGSAKNHVPVVVQPLHIIHYKSLLPLQFVFVAIRYPWLTFIIQPVWASVHH